MELTSLIGTRNAAALAEAAILSLLVAIPGGAAQPVVTLEERWGEAYSVYEYDYTTYLVNLTAGAWAFAAVNEGPTDTRVSVRNGGQEFWPGGHFKGALRRLELPRTGTYEFRMEGLGQFALVNTSFQENVDPGATGASRALSWSVQGRFGVAPMLETQDWEWSLCAATNQPVGVQVFSRRNFAEIDSTTLMNATSWTIKESDEALLLFERGAEPPAVVTVSVSDDPEPCPPTMPIGGDDSDETSETVAGVGPMLALAALIAALAWSRKF